MSGGYTKLFSSILDSSIWHEPLATRVVWITMLAMVDRDGVVHASRRGLARRAGVTHDECDAALQCFLSPDPDSRSTAHEGRRIERVEGGWRLLNHSRYRELLSREDQRTRAAERKRRQRDRSRQERDMSQDERDMSRPSVTVTPGHAVSRMSRHTDTDTDPDTGGPRAPTRVAAPVPQQSTPPPPTPVDPPPDPAPSPPTAVDVALAFSAARQAAGGPGYGGTGLELPPRDMQALKAVLSWARQERPDDPLGVVRESADGYVRARGAAARVAWWCEDPGSYLGSGAAAKDTEDPGAEAYREQMRSLRQQLDAATPGTEECSRLHEAIRELGTQRRRERAGHATGGAA